MTMSSPALSPSSPNGESCRYLTITRIYADDAGESRFGSFTIRMEGSGTLSSRGTGN